MADRWSHAIVIGNDGTVASDSAPALAPALAPAIASQEGSAGEDWPISPVFQELSVEDRGDHQVALLVGMAGKSHWSCSVSPIVSDTETGWEFDVACLAKLPPQWLGSTYANLAKESVRNDLCIQPDESCQINDDQSEQIVLSCKQKNLDLPQTFCWKYRISLSR